MCTAGFPEPRTFSWRVRRALAARAGQFDVVHDNQTFGRGLLGVMADGWPLLGTCHHPITVDRALDLEHAENWRRRLVLRRWYGFLAMQMKVARRIPRILTVSSSSKRDIVDQYGIAADQLEVVPDRRRPHPLPAASRDRPGSRSDHDDGQRRRPVQGVASAGRSRGQAPDRAPRGPPRGGRSPPRRRARFRRPSPVWACPGRSASSPA